MFKGFREFVLRGNVIDLAVAVVIGAAFGAVVVSFTTNVLTPLIAALVGKPDFSSLSFTLNGSRIMYGSFLNALIAFFLVAAAVYYAVIVPMSAWAASHRPAEVEAVSTKCPDCLMEIPAGALVCGHCRTTLKKAA